MRRALSAIDNLKQLADTPLCLPQIKVFLQHSGLYTPVDVQSYETEVREQCSVQLCGY